MPPLLKETLSFLLTVVQGNTVHVLDLAARVDSTAEYLCKAHWGDLSFPPPFGREAMPEVEQLRAYTYAHCTCMMYNGLLMWTWLHKATHY